MSDDEQRRLQEEAQKIRDQIDMARKAEDERIKQQQQQERERLQREEEEERRRQNEQQQQK